VEVLITAVMVGMYPHLNRISGHSPLLIFGNEQEKRYKGFRFEAFWPRIQGFHGVVANSWNQNVSVTNPFLRLHIKLKRVSKALRNWAKGLIGKNKIFMCAVQQLIGILDVVQDFRPLQEQEILLKS
jgi:hypothetical protein